MKNRKLEIAASEFETKKQTKPPRLPGFLGFILNGIKKVEVPSRPGFVFVRVRGSDSELIQAFNDKVAPVYDLPVIITRDEVDRSRYKIVGLDSGMYGDWGSNGGGGYLTRHGHTHSFIPEEGGGGDAVFVYGRQFMPLAAVPSGTSGSLGVNIKPTTYYQDNQWKYAGGTGSPSFAPYIPTDNTARMVLLYLDSDSNPKLLPSATFFNESITGTAEIVPYLPNIGDTTHVPIAGIRLVSGTSEILWENIYDLRPWIVSDSFILTGTFAPSLGNYVVLTGTSGELVLPNERVIVPGTHMSFTDYGPGNTLNVGLQTGTLGGVIGFFVGGELTVGAVPVRNLAPRAGTIQNVIASVYGKPTGSSIVLDINNNGFTIYSTQANRPMISGSYDDMWSVPNSKSFVQDDVFTLDIDEVNSAASNLEVQIRYSY